jgi:hypothetical protein
MLDVECGDVLGLVLCIYFQIVDRYFRTCSTNCFVVQCVALKVITSFGLVLKLAKCPTTSTKSILTVRSVRPHLADMEFTKISEIELPAAFDAHVHLRDGEMSQLVTPTIRQGGVNQVYVMV